MDVSRLFPTYLTWVYPSWWSQSLIKHWLLNLNASVLNTTTPTTATAFILWVAVFRVHFPACSFRKNSETLRLLAFKFFFKDPNLSVSPCNTPTKETEILRSWMVATYRYPFLVQSLPKWFLVAIRDLLWWTFAARTANPNSPRFFTSLHYSSLNSSSDGKCITWKWRMGPFKTSCNLQ